MEDVPVPARTYSGKSVPNLLLLDDKYVHSDQLEGRDPGSGSDWSDESSDWSDESIDDSQGAPQSKSDSMTNEPGSPSPAGEERDLDRSHRFDEDGTATKARKKKSKKSRKERSGGQTQIDSSEDGAARSRRARKPKSTALEIIRESQASVDEDTNEDSSNQHRSPDHQQFRDPATHSASTGTKIEEYLQRNGVHFKKAGKKGKR